MPASRFYHTLSKLSALLRHAQAISLKPDPNPNPNDIDSTQCLVREEDTLNICATSLEVNGEDIVTLFSRDRRLSDDLSDLTYMAKTADDGIQGMRKVGAVMDARAATLLSKFSQLSM